jgi:Ino eighty subunit 1
MRAQLRTYHSIPSLQANQDPNAYKQLQDAPRLKSILKGASEDSDQPATIEKIKELPVPRTNPVHVIFLLAQYAPKISETHFFAPRDFFDLVMRATLSSRSRARAFLWLMWWYLESDFSREAALNNPFGPGLAGEGTEGLPIKVPAFESLTEEQADEENLDTPEEKKYGETKRLERKRILEEEEPIPRITKRSKKQEFGYDDDPVDRASANSTPAHPSARRLALPDEEDDWSTPGSARSRYKRVKRESSVNRSAAQQRLILKTKMDQTPDAASPAPPGHGHPVLNQFVTESTAPAQNFTSRRPRPLTQHQLAVEQNRRQRIEYLLAQRKAEAYRALRAQRETEVPVVRYNRMLQTLPENYDTEDLKAWSKGELLPHPEGQEDYGEAAHYFLSVIRKAARRLNRWDWEQVNGSRKDRRKARAEREAEYQNGSATVGYSGRGARSSRSGRAKPSRSAKRKILPISSAPSSVKRSGTGGSARGSKDGRAVKSRSTLADSSLQAAAGPSSPGREQLSPMPARDDADVEGDETLDDLDKELLGEGSGNEDDESDSSLTDGEEGDDDEMDEAEGEGDVDMEGDAGDHSSVFEGRNGYADSDSSSEAGGDLDNGVDEDEVMDDRD